MAAIICLRSIEKILNPNGFIIAFQDFQSIGTLNKAMIYVLNMFAVVSKAQILTNCYVGVFNIAIA